MDEPLQSQSPKVPPSYPPRTPPPQKKPVEAPRPKPTTRPTSLLPGGLPLPAAGAQRIAARQPRMAVQNRRVSNWALPGDGWAAKKATNHVVETVRSWGYTCPGDAAIERTVHLLVGAAVSDQGRRISVHLADQDDLLLVLVLSHTAAEPAGDVLTQLAAVPSTSSCGHDASSEGRRVWALLETTPPRRTSAA